MNNLLLKLLLTPALIVGVSLIGRRWGPAVAGWIVGLPLTSGPVAFFLALDQGTAFAAASSMGILAGTLSVAAFCLAYSRGAWHVRWPLALLAGWLGFFASTWTFQQVSLPLATLSGVIVVLLVLALWLMPAHVESVHSVESPWWDIPARALVATAVVLLLTGYAPVLGPRLSGLLTPFPILAATLGVFTHRFQGPGAAAGLLRGVMLGLFGFAAFFVVVSALLVPLGIAATFALATAAALLLQGATLGVLRRPRHAT